ncbi:prepilin peptidase [Microbacteriaceae bacterium 4G12]
MIILYSYIFVVGTVLGSFYNVVGMRVPIGQPIVHSRSACPSCSHTLSAKELIPILSYILQGGKCRSCSRRISPIYPIFELITGVLFVLSFVLIGWQAEVLVAWTFVSLFVIIAVSDISYMLIPNKVLLFFAPLFIVERFVVPLQPWWDSVIGAGVGFGLLRLIVFISKGGMGGGDVKLFALIGFVLGFKLVLVTFLLSSLFGTIFGLLGMITGHVKRGEPMPFGPFIMMGSLTAYFFGESLLQYYFSFL